MVAKQLFTGVRNVQETGGSRAGIIPDTSRRTGPIRLVGLGRRVGRLTCIHETYDAGIEIYPCD